MMRYRLVSVALSEANDASAYYENKSVGLGVKFLNKLDEAIQKLRYFPQIGKRRGRRLRSFSMSRFPYDLVYYLNNGEIVIIAVAHQSRRPHYWKGRL